MISKEKLVEILDKNVRGYITRPVLGVTADRILDALKNEHPATEGIEPLAVLADRKGFTVTPMPYTIKRFPHAWNIIIHTRTGSVFSEHTGDSYVFAEFKARAYLESLPDKGGMK